MKKIDWIFGRGLSIDCGLTWTVPVLWGVFPRELRIIMIKRSLRNQMDRMRIQVDPIGGFLNYLEKRADNGWRHEFYTTNWDYLLQRGIGGRGYSVCPKWLATSHVWPLLSGRF